MEPKRGQKVRSIGQERGMRTIKRRIDKLESYNGEKFLAWLKIAIDDELEARLRKLVVPGKSVSHLS
jgi:hypothetical protein